MVALPTKMVVEKMKQGKVTGYRKTRRVRTHRRLLTSGLRWCLPLLQQVLSLWPVIALIVIFLMPETPHLRVSYSYAGSSDHPRYINCQYLGIDGVVRVRGRQCPLVTLMNGSRVSTEALRRPGEYHQSFLQGHRETDGAAQTRPWHPAEKWDRPAPFGSSDIQTRDRPASRAVRLHIQGRKV